MALVNQWHLTKQWKGSDSSKFTQITAVYSRSCDANMHSSRSLKINGHRWSSQQLVIFYHHTLGNCSPLGLECLCKLWKNPGLWVTLSQTQVDPQAIHTIHTWQPTQYLNDYCGRIKCWCLFMFLYPKDLHLHGRQRCLVHSRGWCTQCRWFCIWVHKLSSSSGM